MRRILALLVLALIVLPPGMTPSQIATADPGILFRTSWTKVVSDSLGELPISQTVSTPGGLAGDFLVIGALGRVCDLDAAVTYTLSIINPPGLVIARNSSSDLVNMECRDVRAGWTVQNITSPFSNFNIDLSPNPGTIGSDGYYALTVAITAYTGAGLVSATIVSTINAGSPKIMALGRVSSTAEVALGTAMWDTGGTTTGFVEFRTAAADQPGAPDHRILQVQSNMTTGHGPNCADGIWCPQYGHTTGDSVARRFFTVELDVPPPPPPSPFPPPLTFEPIGMFGLAAFLVIILGGSAWISAWLIGRKRRHGGL